MVTFIASYDLHDKNNPHSAFLQAAEDLGWLPWIKGSDGKWHKLPNTTLRGDFTDMAAATSAFKAIKPAAEVALGKSLKIEKWIVTLYSAAKFVSDETADG